MKWWLRIRCLTVTTAVVLCATLSPMASAQPAAPIIFWYMPNGADPAAAIQIEVDAFRVAYPDVRVQPVLVSWTDAFLRLQGAVQDGGGPCVAQLGTTWVPTFTAQGGLRAYAPAEVESIGGAKAFSDASWQTRGVLGSDVVGALPWFSDVRAIAYRRDVLLKTGLTQSEAFANMDAFERTLELIKQTSPDIAPIVHAGRNDGTVWQNAAMFMWAYGADILTPDGRTAAFNSLQAVAGTTFFYDLYGEGLTAPDTLKLNSTDAEVRFGAGQAATIITGPWIISAARAAKDAGGWSDDVTRANVAFAPFPAGPGGQYTFVGGSNLAILDNCPNPQAALEWVEFLQSRESQARYSQTVGMLPAKIDARSDLSFASDPLFSVFIAAADSGKTAPPIPNWTSVEPVLQEQLQALWDDVGLSGGTPIGADKVQQRLDAAARAVNAVLRGE